MTWPRRAVGRIAALWLFCQAATLAVVPILLDASLAECVCPHRAEAACPMHHKTAGGTKVCAMQSATADVPVTLNALLSIAGLLPTRPQAIVQAPTASAALFERSTLTQRPSPPDPPPPRT